MLRPPVVESVEKLWDTWNIRGLIILSLLVQSFLVLFAPLRRLRGGQWLMILIRLAYLLADWVATFTIGLMLRAEVSDILAFWAPFLLLHLGGPDSITSFSLEDNEFWISHLLGLMLQVGSTVYVVLQSLPENQLWLPTLLVLIAGIIKYAERNRAFYLASFDHFEVKKKEPPIHPEWDVDVGPMAIIKSLPVGPLVNPLKRGLNKEIFIRKRTTVLLKLETELSLLYEALHTKWPVVCCKIGYIFRITSFNCIFGALLSFRLITKHYQLGKFEIWLTYGLLIGAITLDFISIGFLILSDFNLVFEQIPIPRCKIIPSYEVMARNKNRRRWSKRIPQCNFIAYFVNDYPYWLKKLVYFVPIRIVLDAIKLSRCSSSQHFREEQVWRFILEEVREKAASAETIQEGIEICLKRGDGILHSNERYRHLIWSIRNLDYTESLLTWHIATEVCFQFQEDEDHRPTSSSENTNCREISKLISDYMFYLLKAEPSMIATVSNIHQKEVFEEAFMDLATFSADIPSLDEKEISKAIFSKEQETDWLKPPGFEKKVSAFIFARILAFQLKSSSIDCFPWKLMSQVWAEIMCYAAINCRPNVHAEQPGKGGQLLTFVWLLMNQFGLGTQFEILEFESADDIQDRDEPEPTNPNELLLLLLRQRRPVRGRPIIFA